ncbi:MAG: hypothetical protein JW741_17460 [Sedimentisphaerales bacterium]|nr:hypothetical protein [Sedimentisphaerales bacterium]
MTNTVALDPDLCSEIDAFIQLRVKEGFASEDEIVEAMLDYWADPPDFDALEAYVVRTTREALAAHCEAQKSWPEETDCDRLDFAFLVLEEEHGIVAWQNFTCCQTDGHSEIWGEIRQVQAQRPVMGYAFYHEQDTENAARYGELFLAYGAVEESETAQVAVAQRIVDTLRDAGFAVEWNGSVKERVFVTGVDWKKRREACR